MPGDEQVEQQAKTLPDGAADRNISVRRAVLVEHNRIDSADLFATTRELSIRHGAEVYRLRLTAQNKLLLTK